jgi:hypothetical protein
VTQTNLLAARPEMGRERDTLLAGMIRRFSRLGVLQPVEQGAHPALVAATAPEAEGGRLYGPGGFLHLGGQPDEAKPFKNIADHDDAIRMWEISEKWAGVTFPG